MTNQQPLRILGMMSGTSVDSIDVALCSVQQDSSGRIQAELLGFYEHPISETLRRRIFRAFQNGPGSLSLICSLNFEIGEAFADAALAFFREQNIDPTSVDAIASHGQTVYHIAPHMAKQSDGAAHDGENPLPSTLQIGESAVMAERTGLPVISDFRTADMAAGGNGAPLVPFADWHLFSRPGVGVVVHNIGGIANLTLLPASGRMEDVIAFDTGPGNMIIDAIVGHFYPGENYDRDGAHGRAGRVIPELLRTWMSMEYIAAPPPKSTGRELFGVQFARQVIAAHGDIAADDLIATATEFTAHSFARNLADHVTPRGALSEILLAGGGAHNSFLVERVRRAVVDMVDLREDHVRLLDETGFPSKARECIAFALLGYARLRGIPGNVPSATGARRPVLLGKLTEPTPI